MKYQLAIIGGGPAGYTAAEMAGKAGLSVKGRKGDFVWRLGKLCGKAAGL